MDKFRVHVCIPTHDGKIYNECAQGLLESVSLIETVDMRKGSLLPHLRNQLTQAAVRNTKASHVLFLDSDIGFSGKYLLRALMMDERFVFGPVAFKDGSGDIMATADDSGEIIGCSASFILINRFTLERAWEFYAENGWLSYTYDGGDMVGLWNLPQWANGQRMEGEDYAFCRRIRTATGAKLKPVIGTPGEDPFHIGSRYFWPASPHTTLRAYAARDSDG